MAFINKPLTNEYVPNFLNSLQNISLNSVRDLLKTDKKILIVSTNLNRFSNISKLYYILKNSEFNNKIYASDTITFDKKTMTRIRSNIKVKCLHEVKEQCVFVYYKNITTAMLNNRILILTDYVLNDKTKQYESILNKLVKQYKFNYKFKERLVIQKELVLESYDENYYRRMSNRFISKTPVFKNHNYLIFDTETNGLPLMRNYRCVNYNHENGWDNCRMLSIGWLVVDNNFNILNQQYYLIKDETIFNNIHTQKINKIEDKKRNENGILFNDMIDQFFKDLKECEFVVSHGSDFDFNLLIKECIIHDINYEIFKDKIILNTKQNLWKQNHKLGLSEIISLNVNIENEPHNALYDCYLCLELLKIRLGYKQNN